VNHTVEIAVPEQPALSAGARTVARGLRRATLAPGTIGTLAALLDAIALALGLWFAAYAGGGAGFDPHRAAVLALAAATVVIAGVGAFGGYRSSPSSCCPPAASAPRSPRRPSTTG